MATRKKPATRRPAARKPAAKRTTGTRPPARRPTARKPAARRSAAPRRADFGAPVDGVIARQAPEMRGILEALRALVEEAAPDAAGSLKWGMPTFSIGDRMVCALGAHKAHVNLVLSGPPGAFPDPDGRLAGQGAGGRHLRLEALGELPREAVRGWLRIAARHARGAP